jgi:NTE family protein
MAVSELPSSTPGKATNVLVLQGGGALGSYQAGAYQALCHFDFEPDWIAGISIGAINAAIIAGNPREKRVERLKEFWEMVSAPAPWDPFMPSGPERSEFKEAGTALKAMLGVPGFFKPRFPSAPLWPQGSPESQSYYDTAPLRATLEHLVDFDRINDLKTRLSVGAVSVTSGNFRYFDNFEFKKLGKKIGPEHIMASGALPPGFPSIVIEGEHYWDGGIASNTPLDYVLDEDVTNDLLIFQIDLFSARGPLPTTLLEAAEREKDIRFSSRTRMNTDKNKEIHETSKAIRELIAKLPDDLKNDPSVQVLREAAKENTVTVVHLIYRSKNCELSSKDYDFSHASMVEHWNAGVRDVHSSMQHKDRLEPPRSGGLMTYDLAEKPPGVEGYEVTLSFATTRESSYLPGIFFSGERASGTKYGKATVRVPPDRHIGELERPKELKIFGYSIYKQTLDPKIHFILERCDVMEKDAWLNNIRSAGKHEALIFVHGFNVTFVEGIYRCAQIAWDIGYEGVPILFSWASRGKLEAYFYDQTSARLAGKRFVALLADLNNAGITKVHVLAHSMGNYSVLNALANHYHVSEPIGELLMAAPDVDRDDYIDMAPRARLATGGMTLYASSNDRALAAAKEIAGEIPRAGDVPAAGPILVDRVDAIDASLLGDEIFGLNHGTYAKDQSILNDVKRVLADGLRPPNKRLIQIRGMPDKEIPSKWWRYI